MVIFLRFVGIVGFGEFGFFLGFAVDLLVGFVACCTICISGFLGLVVCLFAGLVLVGFGDFDVLVFVSCGGFGGICGLLAFTVLGCLI